MRADNGMNVMHPDDLISVKKGPFTLLDSAPAGSPMMPINGAFHGHTGQIAMGIVFPSPGVYTVNMETNSIPGLSQYLFGHAKTSFEVSVASSQQQQEPLGKATPTTSTTTNLVIPLSFEPNHIAIIGQDSPFFIPNKLTVNVGTVVTIKNHDAIIHTATATDNGTSVLSPTPSHGFDTGLLQSGQQKQISCKTNIRQRV
jgi:plastocyanin